MVGGHARIRIQAAGRDTRPRAGARHERPVLGAAPTPASPTRPRGGRGRNGFPARGDARWHPSDDRDASSCGRPLRPPTLRRLLGRDPIWKRAHTPRLAASAAPAGRAQRSRIAGLTAGATRVRKGRRLGPFLCWAVVFADIGTSVYYAPGILYGQVGVHAALFVTMTLVV